MQPFFIARSRRRGYAGCPMPTVKLEAMDAGDFAAFVERLIPPYAAERAAADHISLEAATAFARKQTAEILGAGHLTPGHLLFNIENGEQERVGDLWVKFDADAQEAFVYEINIYPAFRRQGLASAALNTVQALLKEQGCRVLGLNVFAPNHGAQALYARLGFAAQSSYMNKLL